MRDLITGATGFIGTHLCAALIDRGDDVAALAGPPISAGLRAMISMTR